MKIEFITPRLELQPYISKIWLFESDYSLNPNNSLIAPNARPKIIIPYKNVLTTTDNGKTTICNENDLYFIGIRDVPVTLGTWPGWTGSIGVELTTAGAYKFIHVSMGELTNSLFSFTDLYGKLGRELQQRIGEAENPKKKIAIIQDFLLDRLVNEKRFNSIVDFSVDIISSLNGLIEIKELESKTGYSKRYLDYLFKDHLGISPKTYSTIVRFQKFYKGWTETGSPNYQKDNMYELYYDQSHFIKEFKRYTGLSPMKFAHLNNEFGKKF